MKPPVYQQLDKTSNAPYPLSSYAGKLLWRIVYMLFFRTSPPSPRFFHKWRAMILKRFGAKIGRDCFIAPSVVIWHPWLLEMGDHSALSSGVTIYNLGPITIGTHTVVSQDAYLCAGTHDYTKPDLPLQRPPITVGDGVWICAGAFICPNVTIGDNALIGAKAVVTRNVEPSAIMGGNPARFIRERPMPSDT